MLVDCGPDMREQLLTANIADLGDVIVTHDHADHCHGIDDLRQVSHHRNAPVRLLARPDTLERLRRRFAYAFEGTPLYPAVLDPVAVNDDLRLGHATFRFVDQPHGGITSLGMRIEEEGVSAAYAIDFHEMTGEMAALYDGAGLWICDCLRRKPHPTHAHLDAVLGWARDLNVGQLLLTHLDKSMDYATLAAELPDWAAPAHDGQEIVM